MARGCPGPWVLPRHPSLRCRTGRQRSIRGRDDGCGGHGPGRSAPAAGTLEEEPPSGRGRDGRCPCRRRPDCCRAADHQVFHQPGSLTAGAGDRGHAPDSDHRVGNRLGIGAARHRGSPASQHPPTGNQPAAERHRRPASHRDDGRTAEDRRHGPAHRRPERKAAHHTGAGQGDARRQRRRPGPTRRDHRARRCFHRTPQCGHIDCERSADNVGGRSGLTDAAVPGRRVHRLIPAPESGTVTSTFRAARATCTAPCRNHDDRG